jgi:hypothetical protein
MVHRADAQNFTFFALDFSAGEQLTGEYASCGPVAYAANPRTFPPGSVPLYSEGAIRIQRQSNPPPPDSPVERYGYDGTIGGEHPLCDTARDTPALWAGTAAQPPDTRRATQTSLSCNRGPGPGDPFACAAQVIDAGTTPGASSPAGAVVVTSPSGSVSSNTCGGLTPGAQNTSTCTFTYTNPSIGAGQAVPVAARYLGSAIHRQSEGGHLAAVPESPQPGGGTPAEICGAPPLKPCAPAPPNPTQTCVGNVGGACTNPSQQPVPLKICIANVGAACNGFASGAKLAGVWDTASATVEADVACPSAGTGSPARRRSAAHRQSLPDLLSNPCKYGVKLTADERVILRLYAEAFKREVRLRYAVLRDRDKSPAWRRDPGGDLRAMLPKSLRTAVDDHNLAIHPVNLITDDLVIRKPGGVGEMTFHLNKINIDVPANRYAPYSVGADDEYYVDPRMPGGSVGLPIFRAAGRAVKPRRVKKGYGPSIAKLRTRTVTLGTRSVTVPAGKRSRVKIKLTKAARSLLRAAAAMGDRSLPVVARVDVASATGRFAPTTATRSLRVKLKPRKRR